MLTWLLNDDVGNSLNVAGDVNVNVNDVNEVNCASNANTVADEKKFLINRFPKLSIEQIFPNVRIEQILNWSEIFSPYL